MHAAFDFGAVYQGYCSDFGRTVFCGEPSAEMAKVHALIMEAQSAGMAVMRAGQATGADADAAARGKIVEAGYGQFFWHRLGHGIGCDVHEPPFLTRSETITLEAGMTFTVEPSVHKGREAAVRVEDVVLVTAEGGESLNKTSHDLTVIE
jgi:Xaa-Pro aminopeptidase